MKVLSMTAAALLVGATVYGQTADEAAAAKKKIAAEQKMSLMVRAPFEAAIKGAPYSAETLLETTQTLADGNHIDRKATGRIYRDSDGRTRREEDRQDGTVGISIVDPVAGTCFRWDPVNRVAWKTSTAGSGALMNNVAVLKQKLAAQSRRPRQAGGQGAGTGEVSPSNPHMTVRPATGDGGFVVSTDAGSVMMRGEAYKMADNTPLEHKTIDGLAVEGRKSTVTIPAGDVGNDQPITLPRRSGDRRT